MSYTYPKRAVLMPGSSHQTELKQLLCDLRNTHHHTTQSLKPQNLFVGVGSDEAIGTLSLIKPLTFLIKSIRFSPSMFLYSWARQDLGLSSNLWVRTLAVFLLVKSLKSIVKHNSKPEACFCSPPFVSINKFAVQR